MPPRKPRMKKNRNPEVGMKNRQLGMSKMANTWYQYYGGHALVLIRKQDGGWAGFQSYSGLTQKTSLQSLRKVPLLGPQNFVEEPKFLPNMQKSPSLDFCDKESDLSPSQNASGIGGPNLPSSIFSHPPIRTEAPVQSPEILQPKPISGRQLRQKQALVALLEHSFT
ncbi:hypothetical protein FGADI_4559 [Fusarium gaditjirri]|uniref:Uncharacterized protein n=1 Tax=Fusarium gaditjirri TaxID=282569 RepID=A0A8H4TCM8_9HYPO|nr:hypothetical protein FGADI_4559 [Fusarium gaditjirri]